MWIGIADTLWGYKEYTAPVDHRTIPFYPPTVSGVIWVTDLRTREVPYTGIIVGSGSPAPDWLFTGYFDEGGLHVDSN